MSDRRDSRDFGCSYAQWRALRLSILERDGWRCYVCNGPANTVDHLTPRSLGGSNHPANLRACCGFHNASKKDRVSATPVVSRAW